MPLFCTYAEGIHQRKPSWVSMNNVLFQISWCTSDSQWNIWHFYVAFWNFKERSMFTCNNFKMLWHIIILFVSIIHLP
jgi:hypothetical protein